MDRRMPMAGQKTASKLQECYILRRHQKPTIYLSPFQDATTAGRWDADNPVQWYASGTLTMQEKDDATTDLYYAVDRGVSRWIQDARYIPRLLVVAFVFLASYFIMSLAIRDPIPIIDELLIAGGISLVTWLFLAKKEAMSGVAMKKRLSIKQTVGDAKVDILPGLDVLEAYLADIASCDPMDICDRLCLCSQPLAPLYVEPAQRGPWVEDVYSLLIPWVKVHDRRAYHRYRQVQQVRKAGKRDEALSASMMHQSMAGKLDIALVSLCVAYSEMS